MKSDKLREYFYNKTPEEMEIFLEGIDEKNYALDEETLKRIQQKSGIPLKTTVVKKRKRSRIGWFVAAVLLIALVTRRDEVRAALQNLFSFVPGVGIEEVSEGETLLFGEDITVEDPKGILQEKPSFVLQGKGLLVRYGGKSLKVDSGRGTYQLLINGEKTVEVPDSFTGSAGAGSEYFRSVYFDSEYFRSVYFDVELKEKDEITFTSLEEGFSARAKMVPGERMSPESFPSVTVDNVTLYAKVEDGGDYWEIYVYPEIPGGRPDYGFYGGDIQLKTEEGTVEVEAPRSYGSSHLPPLKVKKGSFTRGTLIIPYIDYSVEETARVKIPVPKDQSPLTTENRAVFTEGSVKIDAVRLASEAESLMDEDGKPEKTIHIKMRMEGKEKRLVGIRLEKMGHAMTWDEGKPEVDMYIPWAPLRSTMTLELGSPTYRVDKPFELPLKFGE